MVRFCPICGKKGIKTDFCEDCRPQVAASLEFKDIKVRVCAFCNKYFYNGRWYPFVDLADAVTKVAIEKIKNPDNLPLVVKPEIPEIEFKQNKSYDIEIFVEANEKEYTIPAKIEVIKCKKCSRKGTQYFEGILQLRNCEDRVIQYAERLMKSKEDDGLYITKEADVKNGKDYYVTDKKILKIIVAQIAKKYNGIVKEAHKLFSRDRMSQKAIYRSTYLFRQLNYQLGDIVKIGDSEVKVKHIGAKNWGVDLKTGKKVFIPEHV